VEIESKTRGASDAEMKKDVEERTKMSVVNGYFRTKIKAARRPNKKADE
jgi:hypothetical protein